MKVVLFAPPPAFGTPSMSPFCAKLDCFLRMRGIEFETGAFDARKAPKGKMPYVTIDGQTFCDSQHIIEELQRRLGPGSDEHLGAAERAQGHFVRRAMEEAFYFELVYDRWFTDDGWETYKPHFATALPSALRGLLPGLIRRSVKKTLRAQGTGRHSAAEVYAMAADDLAMLSAILGDKPYLLGDEPTSFDCAPFAMLDGVRCFPRKGPMQAALEKHPNLIAYQERMKQRYYA